MSNFLETKKLVAGYEGNPSGSLTRYVPADFIIDSIDFLALAINNARRTFERLHDFQHAQTEALLAITASGTSIDEATDVLGGAISIKRVQEVMLPIGGSAYIPCEFSTSSNYLSRIQAQIGRTRYSSTNTMDEYGGSIDSPVAVQQGPFISLVPTDQFSFPITVKLNVFQFMPDYSSDADHDFFLDFAPEAIQWQAIVELNRLAKNFSVRPSEGDVSEPMDLAQIAFESLVTWDLSINAGTSTPDAPIPQIPRPPAKKQ